MGINFSKLIFPDNILLFMPSFLIVDKKLFGLPINKIRSLCTFLNMNGILLSSHEIMKITSST